MNDDKKVLFLFTGRRNKTIQLLKTKELPDTSLYGLNHFSRADYLTVEAGSVILKIGRIVKALPRLFKYDFIIAQDNLVLGWLVSWFATTFGLKNHWLYLTMTSSTMIKRHARHPIRRFILKTIWKSYHRVICLSRQQLEQLAQFGIPRSHLTFVPFGIDTSFFRSSPDLFPEDFILSVGRDAGRDYETLFQIAERSNYRYVLVSGEKNIPPNRPLPPNVSVFYELDPITLRDFYARAKLVLVVSKPESVPEGSDCSGQIVVMDALAMGKAVVATDRSWIKDYFIPDQDLVVVEANNPEVLIAAVNKLWSDPEAREKLGQAGQAKVKLRYTTQTFAQALKSLMS
jgi:glycosyltransferase involved in cell wall biosynthesis